MIDFKKNLGVLLLTNQKKQGHGIRIQLASSTMKNRENLISNTIHCLFQSLKAIIVQFN